MLIIMTLISSQKISLILRSSKADAKMLLTVLPPKLGRNKNMKSTGGTPRNLFLWRTPCNSLDVWMAGLQEYSVAILILLTQLCQLNLFLPGKRTSTPLITLFSDPSQNNSAQERMFWSSPTVEATTKTYKCSRERLWVMWKTKGLKWGLVIRSRHWMIKL